MAVVWAKSNGNWATASIWAFWNEATQQIEDYNQVPQVDDVVYCNSRIIQVNVLNYTYLQVKEIRNDLNPYTSHIGGWVDVMNNVDNSRQLTIVCDFFGKGTTSNDQILRSGIDGDNLRRNTALILNGNFFNCFVLQNFRAPNTSVITGNVAEMQWQFVDNSASNTKSLTVNGNAVNLKITSNSATTSLIVNGSVTTAHETLITGVTNKNCTINGAITFATTNDFEHSIRINGIADFSETTTINEFHFPFRIGFGIINSGNITVKIPNLTDYPAENDVKRGVRYAFGNLVGALDPVIVGCVTKEDVRKDVPLVGMGVVGSLVVPSVDDVREGVIFDNGSVGTLIVQGGGDRLRIANFSYYTDSQSDTYIVDLTEQDKPKFAVAEERVLIEMFPDLDLENIPEKYFDDLFVKYLKYRLIVEYYRTAGINSTFTPSEPTTEIVNYRNVNCEIWMNIANTYLKAWGEKYPNSIKKQRILL